MKSYLAYGSNLHPVRLQLRIASVKSRGIICLSGYKLVFNKIGVDGSAKCNIIKEDKSVAYCAVYEVTEMQIYSLDEFESSGRGYEKLRVTCRLDDRSEDCFTYIAMPEYIDDHLLPFDWYKEMVVVGARYHRLPIEYIRNIEAVQAIKDLDIQRVGQARLTLSKMLANEARVARVA